MYLFFDTETNGLLKRGAKIDNPREVDKFPRIIQMAWALYTTDGQPVRQEVHLIRPDGWVIPQEKFWIENGFATHINEAHGKPIAHVLTSFATDLEKADMLIAHNMDFDYPVTAAEMIRKGIRAQKKPLKHCTMKTNADMCKIPGKFGSYKWPTLSELHTHLFGDDFEGAHDAMWDVEATVKCFFEIKHREQTKLDVQAGIIGNKLDF